MPALYFNADDQLVQWFANQRTMYGKITALGTKSGTAGNRQTERNRWIEERWRFLSGHIVRAVTRTSAPKVILLQQIFDVWRLWTPCVNDHVFPTGKTHNWTAVRWSSGRDFHTKPIQQQTAVQQAQCKHRPHHSWRCWRRDRCRQH